jgi:O-antigen ligase
MVLRYFSEFKERLKSLAWGGLGIVAVGGGIIFAQGRAVWLGVAVGLVVVGFMLPRSKIFKFLFVAVVSASILLVFLPFKIRGRMMSIYSHVSGSLGDQRSKDTRYELWKESWRVIKAHPVAGVGLKGAELHITDPTDGKPCVWSESHNMFLQNAVESGLVGLGLFLWILVLLFKAVFRLPADLKRTGLGILSAFMIAGLTESWHRDKEIGMIFWSLVGVLEVRRQSIRNRFERS